MQRCSLRHDRDDRETRWGLWSLQDCQDLDLGMNARDAQGTYRQIAQAAGKSFHATAFPFWWPGVPRRNAGSQADRDRHSAGHDHHSSDAGELTETGRTKSRRKRRNAETWQSRAKMRCPRDREVIGCRVVMRKSEENLMVDVRSVGGLAWVCPPRALGSTSARSRLEAG